MNELVLFAGKTLPALIDSTGDDARVRFLEFFTANIAIFGIPSLNAPQFAATETAVQALGLEAEIMEVRVVDDFDPAR
jgi:hypothetical protein